MGRLRITRKRVGWWLAGLAVVGAVGLTYRLTRPPELVWWTGPSIEGTELRVRVLAPRDWRMRVSKPSQWDLGGCEIDPKDNGPSLLQRVLGQKPEFAYIGVDIIASAPETQKSWTH